MNHSKPNRSESELTDGQNSLPLDNLNELSPLRLESEIGRRAQIDPLSSRRLYLRPAGDGTARFRASLPDGGTITAECNSDGNMMLGIHSESACPWSPFLLYQQAGTPSRTVRLKCRSMTFPAERVSYAMSADGGEEEQICLKGMVDAGFVYELTTDEYGTTMFADLYAPAEHALPSAIELKLQSRTDQSWDAHSLIRKVPSDAVHSSEFSAGELPRRLARLWLMLKQQATCVRRLRTDFSCPDQTDATEWMSLVVYPDRIAEYLPQPGQCFLTEQLDDQTFVTNCRLADVVRASGAGAGRTGFFVTVGRRKQLQDDFGRLSEELPFRSHVQDEHAREDLQHDAKTNCVQKISEGAATSLLTDDKDKKATYYAITRRNGENTYYRNRRMKRTTSLHAEGYDDEIAIESDPTEKMILQEEYNRALKLLRSVAGQNLFSAVRLAALPGYTAKEAAEAYGVPEGTIRSCLYRFRRKWEDRHDGDQNV